MIIIEKINVAEQKRTPLPLITGGNDRQYVFLKVFCKTIQYGIKDIRMLNSGSLKALSQFTDK